MNGVEQENVPAPRWRVERDVGGGELASFVEALASGGAAEYLGTLRRRTVTLHRFRFPDGDSEEMVVKVFPTRSSAELAFTALDRLAKVMENGLPEVRSLRPLALATSLPAFAMPYVGGPTLRDLLVREPWRVGGIMTRAGRALATIHNLSRCTADEGGRGVLTRRARAVGLGSTADASASSELVRRYVDFHPHNLILAEDEALVVIDPPIYEEVTHIHHDIVNFVYKAQKCLVMPPWDRARARCLLDFTEALTRFLSSYFSAAGRTMTAADVALLKRYLSLYVTLQSRRIRWREDLPYRTLFGPLLRQQLRSALRRTDLGHR